MPDFLIYTEEVSSPVKPRKNKKPDDQIETLEKANLLDIKDVIEDCLAIDPFFGSLEL